MCGRFSSADNGEMLVRLFLFPRLPEGYAPRYNIAPSQTALVVTEAPDNTRQAQMLRWGLIPFWAKEPSMGNRMVNARAETLANKPTFRYAFRLRRCVVPATGFYEWQKQGNRRVPFYFRLRSGHPFGMAGLWEEWSSPHGPLCTFTVITTEPNETVAPIHNRMPVILTPEGVETWLDHSAFQPNRLQGLLQPYASEDMQGYRVSTLVNSPSNDLPECVTTLEGL